MMITPTWLADRGNGVERFMKRYYLAVRNVGNLTRIFCAAMETDFRKALKFGGQTFCAHMILTFCIEGGRVRLLDDFCFGIACAFTNYFPLHIAMMLMFTPTLCNGYPLIINADATTRNDALLIGSFLISTSRKPRTGFAPHE